MTEERLDILKTKNAGNVLRHVQRYIWAAELVTGRVIDVACGTGYGTHLLSGSHRVKSILGVDISAEAIEICKDRYGHAAPRLDFLRADALQIQGARTIVCFETIEHLKNPIKFLHRVHHVLEPGGHLIISAPLDEKPGQNKYHLHTYTEDSFLDLIVECGFEIRNAWLQRHPKSRTLVLRVRRLEA